MIAWLQKLRRRRALRREKERRRSERHERIERRESKHWHYRAWSAYDAMISGPEKRAVLFSLSFVQSDAARYKKIANMIEQYNATMTRIAERTAEL